MRNQTPAKTLAFFFFFLMMIDDTSCYGLVCFMMGFGIFFIFRNCHLALEVVYLFYLGIFWLKKQLRHLYIHSKLVEIFFR
jgi:hypothetical protein